MFKKLAVFTDIHFGLKSNSKLHNDDCEEFVDWYIDLAKQHGCETGMFCGDWHHNRNSVNITTMDASIRSLEKIGKAFDNFYFFPGNHDLYYRDKRDIQSAEWAKHVKNVEIINDFHQEGDVQFVPWLVGEDYKKIPKLEGKYMFSHLELPHFFMNAMVQMPDTGNIQREDFRGVEQVFTGHFHKRQVQGNIHYIGNAFPHNYADAWDDKRGMMILDRENDKEPEFLDWPDCPKYRTTTLSKLLDPNSEVVKPNMYLRVTLDLPISYEEAQFIKETYINNHQCREITLIPQKQVEEISTELDISKFESVDEIVSKEIAAIDSDNFNKKTLLDIYSEL